jgi:hypothetical protein
LFSVIPTRSQHGSANTCDRPSRHRFSWSTPDFMEMLKRFPNFVLVHNLLIHPSRFKFLKIISPCLLYDQLSFQKVKFTISQNTKFREPPLKTLLLTIPFLKHPRYTNQKNERVEFGNRRQNESPCPPKCSVSHIPYNFLFFMLRKFQYSELCLLSIHLHIPSKSYLLTYFTL